VLTGRKEKKKESEEKEKQSRHRFVDYIYSIFPQAMRERKTGSRKQKTRREHFCAVPTPSAQGAGRERRDIFKRGGESGEWWQRDDCGIICILLSEYKWLLELW